MTTSSFELIWAESTKKLLDAFCRRPQGSVYITGPSGSGRTTVLQYLVGQIIQDKPSLNPVEQLIGPSLKFESQKLEPKHYRLEAIQQLLQRLSLAPPDPENPRLVVIDDFDQIALGSQNALLKYLEEPNQQTSFLITAGTTPGQVLATIISRCQPIEIRRPSRALTLSWLEACWPETSPGMASQIYTMADGWPATIVDLLDEPEQSATQRQIDMAKQFLTADDGPAGRLAVIQELSGSDAGQSLQDLLAGLRRSSRGALANLAAQNQVAEARRWQQRLLIFDRLNKLLESGSSPAAVGLALSLFDQPRTSGTI